MLTRSILPLQTSPGFRNNYSIVVEEHDSHHISLPPFNPLAIVQAPVEDEDMLTGSILPLQTSPGFRNNYCIVVEEHDSHHISLPSINPLDIVQTPEEAEGTFNQFAITSSKKRWHSEQCQKKVTMAI